YPVLLALSGLLALAAGFRLVADLLPSRPIEDDSYRVHNLKGLFWLVMAVYGVNYVLPLNTKMFGGFDVILDRVLDLRQVPLLLLSLKVLRRRTDAQYLWITLVWVFVPRPGS